MGGGLFNTPLYLNPKCLVFSVFILAVYWLPHPSTRAHNIVMGFFGRESDFFWVKVAFFLGCKCAFI